MVRILIVSPGHSPDRSSRQPWAYLQGIANGLSERGHEVAIVGDGPESDKDAEHEVYFVDSVRSPSDLVSVAQSFVPDVCLWSVSPKAPFFLTGRFPELADTMVAVVPGPVYSPDDFVRQLSTDNLSELTSYASLLASSMVPKRGFAAFLRRYFDAVIAPTDTALEILDRAGVPRSRLIHVPHGRETGLLADEVTESSEVRTDTPSPPDSPYVLNFGPPRPIRGAQDFVDATSRLQERGVDIMGVSLARIDDEADRQKLDAIERDLVRGGLQDKFLLCNRYLTPAELTQFIEEAAAVALPYRVVQSTVPISIIEALGSGRPVITTSVQGAQELVPSTDLTVPPGDPSSLASALEEVVTRAEAPTVKFEDMPTWASGLDRLDVVLDLH